MSDNEPCFICEISQKNPFKTKIFTTEIKIESEGFISIEFYREFSELLDKHIKINQK